MKYDVEIRQDIINQLQWEPFINAAVISIDVKNGIVTLSGTVESFAQKIAVENAVKKVSGVKAIAEDVMIGVTSKVSLSDTAIAEAIVASFNYNTIVPKEKIKVKVEEGIVTLEGEVQWNYQRVAAIDVIVQVQGVRNIISLLTIKPRQPGVNIKDQIRKALRRKATIDADRITVEVINNKAILRGKVSSYAEKEDAIDAAWCAPGITKVESYLEVEPQLELIF